MKPLSRSRLILIICFLIIIIAASAILTGHVFRTNSDNGKTISKQKKVLLYSSLQNHQLEAIEKAFEKYHPDIDMSFFSSGTGNILTKLTAEKQNGSIKADVLWIGNPNSYDSLLESDDLLEDDSPWRQDISPHFLGNRETRLIPARLITMGFIYNTERIAEKDIPRSWESFLMLDNSVISDPYSSGTTLNTLQQLAQDKKYGWEYLLRLKESDKDILSGSAATAYQVGVGTYKAGLIADHVAAMIKGLGYPVDFVLPAEDIVTITSPMALIKGSQNSHEARLLIDFILSDAGQNLLASIDIQPIRGPLALSPTSGKLLVMTEQILTTKEFLSVFDHTFLSKEKVADEK